MSPPDPWLQMVEERVESFAIRHSFTYAKTKREIYAAFEIGCFHALVAFYEQRVGSEVTPRNLTADNEYKYSTSPQTNPWNVSYVEIGEGTAACQIRQQIRIRSHHHTDIAFTPDIVVLRPNAQILGLTDDDYANGRRRLFCVDSQDVIAAHECKSMDPFPELLVSFLGMVTTAHEWYEAENSSIYVDSTGQHLAPTLFVGGAARPLNLRMVRALELMFPLNIVVGLHFGSMNLLNRSHMNALSVHSGTPAATVSEPFIDFD